METQPEKFILSQDDTKFREVLKTFSTHFSKYCGLEDFRL